ncbi:MAG TPA: zinc ribbon domain-containing protein [Anaerolineales bacterium]|nr:zinc ribbon domain-containing protein [Anaerolineales bacterium]
MRPFRWWLALVVLAVWPSMAFAQAQPRVEQLTVSMWPEFDRPDLLVIYRIRLASDAPLPTQLSVSLPESFSALNAVATVGPQGTLLNANYTQQTRNGTTVLVIDSDSLDIQVEFYTPIQRTDEQRSFTFTWPGGLTADRLIFEVQEPVGAENLTLAPAAGSRATGEFELMYQRVDLGALEAADQPTLTVNYTRTTAQFTSDFLVGPTPLGTPQAGGGRTPDLTAYLPWALLALGILLLAGGGIYYLRTRSREASPRPRHRRASAAEDPLEASPVYCHNCGARASATDRFCRQCGTPLRR